MAVEIKHIIKRDGSVKDFDVHKIVYAIECAGKATNQFGRERAQEITDTLVMPRLRELSVATPHIEQVQDAVEHALYEAGHFETLRAYIVYREQRARNRDAKKSWVDVESSINEYLNQSDWRVNANANQGYSLGGLILNVSSKVIANYWLNFMANGKQARIDNRLYEKIADQDYRKANFQKAAFGKFIAPSTNGFATDGSEYDIGSYINLKFAANVGIGGKIGNTTVSQPGIIDYSLFRVSEAYLMKAEAQAQSGQGDPKATLNILISARTNGALDCDSYPSMSGMSALDMVKLQTRIEMWGEHSLEFYNNRRWKVNVDRSGSTVHHTAGQIPYAQLVLQIPQQEINTNNLIVQNP